MKNRGATNFQTNILFRFINVVKKYIRQIDPHHRSNGFSRSVRNAAYSSADYLLLPILWLISTPIFIFHLGTEQFGIWMLVNTFIGVSGIMGFGLTDATIRYVSKYRAMEDEAQVVRVVQSTLTMYSVLGIVTSAIVFFIAPLLVNHIFKIEKQNVILAIQALRIGGIGIVIRFFDSLFQSAIYGYERYDLTARVNMIANVLTIGLNLILVFAGYGLIAILVNTFGWIVASGCCKAWLAKNKVIKSLAIRPILDRAILKKIFAFGIFSWLQGIGGILFHQIDRILVASILGMTALSSYVICLQLAQQIHALLARTVSFIFPMASAIKERGAINPLRSLYFKGLNFTTAAAIMIGFPLFMCTHGVLNLWMGQSFADEASSVLRVLIFSTCILATSIVPYYYLNGTGYVRLNTLFGLVSGSIVAIAGILLIPWLGIIGAAWARTANTPTGIISRTILHYKVLSDMRWYAGISVILPVLSTFAIGFGLLQFMGEPKLSLIMLIFRGAGYAFLGLFLAIILGRLFNSHKWKA
ncbi:putative Polysaccharide biosynthesis protein C-terminal domain-containing protein [Candidatus Magnetomoraceae bacterium gMMP-15]